MAIYRQGEWHNPSAHRLFYKTISWEEKSHPVSIAVQETDDGKIALFSGRPDKDIILPKYKVRRLIKTLKKSIR